MPTLSSDNENSSYSQCAYNAVSTVAAIAAPALVAYFAAPYLALATRAVFPAAYAMAVGTPSTFGYYTQYVPAREYACNLVYNNAHVIVGATVTGAHVIAGATSAAIKVTEKAVSTVASSAGFFSSSKPANPIQEKPLVEQDELENDFVVLN